jgi:hypothetical protein
MLPRNGGGITTPKKPKKSRGVVIEKLGRVGERKTETNIMLIYWRIITRIRNDVSRMSVLKLVLVISNGLKHG